MTRVLVVAGYDDALNAHSAQRERALERHGQTVTRFDLNARPGLLNRLRGGDLVSRLDRELAVVAPDIVLVVRGEALSAQAVTTLRRDHPGTWVNWVPDDLHGLAIVQHALPAYDLVFAAGTDVVEALKSIYDPEIPVNIYELGLIYNVEVRDDRSVAVRLTLTSPM